MDVAALWVGCIRARFVRIVCLDKRAAYGLCQVFGVDLRRWQGIRPGLPLVLLAAILS